MLKIRRTLGADKLGLKRFLEENPQIDSIIFYDDLEENLNAVKSIINKNIYYKSIKMTKDIK